MVTRTDPLFPRLALGSDFAERCVVTNSNVHQTSHMHSDQFSQREAVSINHNVYATAKLRRMTCEKSPKTVVALGLSSIIDLQPCLVYFPRFPRRGSQVAKAELCKSSIVGSIPTLASIFNLHCNSFGWS